MGNPSVNKRQKEKDRQDRQADKRAKRQERTKEKEGRPASEGDVDPDIAGIVPGPQPIADDE